MISYIIKFTSLLFCLTALSLYGEGRYLLCIEGGASKTILQVINQDGQIVSLIQEGVSTDRIEAAGSNMNTIGLGGVRRVFEALFAGTSLVEREREINLKTLLPESRIIAGMAGAALPQNRQALIGLFQEYGISADRIIVMSDAEMALQLIHGDGIILIAGTGSICLGKRGETRFRVGGLGRVLGDEGSGYQIGLQALKAALAEEYGWGIPTRLTPALKEQFQVSELKLLLPKINAGEIFPSKIASSAPLVFRFAWEQDEVADGIINQAADQLSSLLDTLLNRSLLSNCEVHLWGGIFKNEHSEAFIRKIRDRLPEAHQNLILLNQSKENPALLYALQNLFSLINQQKN